MKMQKFQTNAAINNPETGDALPQFFDVSWAECEASIKPHTVAIHAYCEKNEIPMLAAVQRRNTADSYGMTGSTLIPGNRATSAVKAMAELANNSSIDEVLGALMSKD